ncbi:helix-turn-helix domain-containing protein [Paenibacillus sp. ACRRX]|uniref:helix-turn-helix transcriptional regulator n=1 Tax=Paenibacillus sp. ACRRX TaxID=2918206 RepID=UPI001EF5977D|nr:helix-turn-helix domain-containing protein [Paenibacillus sp. ACRRX]MCG7406629.1 helix-turn-helix domain-containing protein [Paenibacillus sp. ACRRX]
MRHHFFVDSPERFEETIRRMAIQRYREDYGHIRTVHYEMLERWGTGRVEVYRVLNCATLMLYDVTFHDDVIFEYEMKRDYFGLSYCIDGELELQEQGENLVHFKSSSLSLSKSCDMRGCTRHYGGQRYQSVSLTADSEQMSLLFGSSGSVLWEQAIHRLDNATRQRYFIGVQASADIIEIFNRIYNCRFPEKSKILYYEGKVMELLSLLLAVELPRQEDMATFLLDDYEIRQIRLGHDKLMETLGNPPTLTELSKELAISRNKLTKGYKLIFGQTIYVHYRKTCMQNATAMLANLNKSIQDIALDVGYSNASNFCNAFKREFGLTPLQYRKSKLKRFHPQTSTHAT